MILSNVEEMLAFGKSFGKKLPPNSILALHGDLGSGKTTFTQGLGLGLDIQDSIHSPTFNYFHLYDTGRLPLFHFDLYRFKTDIDFFALGFDEYWRANGITVMEWAKKIEAFLPPNTIHLHFFHDTPSTRKTIIDAGEFSWD